MVITGKEFNMISILKNLNVSPANIGVEKNCQIELKRLNSGQLLFCLVAVGCLPELFLIDTVEKTNKVEDNFIRIGELK